MLEVSALSVRIDVDMSAFFEAMEDVTAMMLATADVFEKVGKEIAASFKGITQAGEENKGFWADFFKFVEMASDIKDFAVLLGMLAKALATLFVGISSGALVEEIAASVAEFSALVGPVGWAVGGIALLTLAYMAFSRASSDATEQTDKVIDHNEALAAGAKAAKGPLDALNTAMSEANASLSGLETSQYKFSLKGNSLLGESNQTTPGQQGNTGSDKSTDKDGDNASDPNNGDYFDQRLAIRMAQVKHDMGNLNGNISISANSNALTATDNGKDKSAQTNAQDDAYKKLIPDVNAANDATQRYNETVKENAELQKEVQDSAVSAFSSIGQALGQMIAGQKAINPLAALMKQMGDSLKKYGEFLITAGTAMLFGGDPYGAAKVGEGIALEAVGTAMGAVKMAQGGIVSGSTFANIGEYAGASHNPEVVAPLDKLRNMMGGNNSNMHYSFEIMGDKMVTAMQRQSANNNFVLGTNNQ